MIVLVIATVRITRKGKVVVTWDRSNIYLDSTEAKKAKAKAKAAARKPK